jgi:hypothetical protein
MEKLSSSTFVPSQEQAADVDDSSLSLKSSASPPTEATVVSSDATPETERDFWQDPPTYEVQEDDNDPAWIDHVAPLAPDEVALAKAELARERKRR